MSRLYPCVYCTEDGYCKKYSDEEVTSWCVQSPCKDEKPSNADRIRGMTDEELAKFLTTEDMCELICSPAPPHCDGQCKQKMLDWLKQEASE